jgi:glycosyltransferase involved in cell wall biosynthesis
MKRINLGNISAYLSKMFFHGRSYDEINWSKYNDFLTLKNKVQKPILSPPSSLSIIIPCYNHSRYIRSALQSAISQTIIPDEIIIVNDASPDSSANVIREWMNEVTMQRPDLKTKIVLISNKKNMGQAYSLNKGIGEAKSDLIMILNDDDLLMSDAVEAVFRIFLFYSNLVLFGSTCIPFSNDEIIRNHEKKVLKSVNTIENYIKIYNPDNSKEYIRSNDINMTHSSCTFYKEIWHFVGGYMVNKKDRIVPFSDRDLQLRINGIFPVGISENVPFVFWRENSSVDAGRNS